MQTGRRCPGLLAIAAGLAVQLAAGMAPAQPIRLLPPGGESPPASTAQPAPAQPAAPEPDVSPAPAAQQSNTPPVGAAIPVPGDVVTPADSDSGNPVGFVIQPLTAPDPSSAGLLDDSNGGLGATMWRGTDPAQAARAIGILPGPVPSAALRGLQRRLLLTTAEVPDGPPRTPSLLGLRVAQLYRLGAVAAAEQLSVPKPAGLKDPVFLQVAADAALLRGEDARACDLIGEGLRGDGSVYWQKLNVLCRYAAKDIAGGDLALSLWRDGGGNDPAFNALAAALRGDGRARVETLGGATALHFALLRAAGRPLPKDTLDVAPPALLAALASYDKADPDLRLAATERAVLYGALPATRLGEAYAAFEIPEAQRATLAAGKEISARMAAFLYQSAQAAEATEARASLVARAHDLAVARKLLLPTAAAYRPLLAALAPNEAGIAAAPAVIRMALAAGETGTARLWRNTLMTLPPERGNAGEIAAAAWPLLLLAGDESEWRDSRYQAWQATLMEDRKTSTSATLLILAEGIGIEVPAERWDELLAAPQPAGTASASVAIWRHLARAVEAEAKAETVALSLAMLGPDSAATDGQALATALTALRKIGLEAETRQIALEAALLRGF